MGSSTIFFSHWYDSTWVPFLFRGWLNMIYFGFVGRFKCGWIVRMCFGFSVFALMLAFEFMIWVFPELSILGTDGEISDLCNLPLSYTHFSSRFEFCRYFFAVVQVFVAGSFCLICVTVWHWVFSFLKKKKKKKKKKKVSVLGIFGPSFGPSCNCFAMTALYFSSWLLLLDNCLFITYQPW